MFNNNQWFNNMNMNMGLMNNNFLMNNMNNNMMNMNINNMNNMNGVNMMNNNMNLNNQNNFMFGMNMNNNNNFGNNNMNNIGMNMANFNNNFYKMNLLNLLYNQYKNQKDGFSIQLGIALGLNNNKPYNNYLKPPSFSFLTSSSVDNNSANLGDPDVVNIIFVTSHGNRHARRYKKNEKIYDVLNKFLSSVGLNENALSQIHFLFNAANLINFNKDKTLQQIGIFNNSKINVVDINNIIGAYKSNLK